jgi:hypothetical protein
MAEQVKIELIGDGYGNVLVFKNGQPAGQFGCDYRLADELTELLDKELCRYHFQYDEEEDE